MKYPLNTPNINKIKNNIRELSETFQTDNLEKDNIGMVPMGRKLVEAMFWPVDEALALFEKDGAIKLVNNTIEIIKMDYFSIRHNELSLPVTFSIDERIKINLAIMTALYAELYDVENRLRFFIATKLEAKYGSDFIKHLPRAVRDSIDTEKTRTKLYVLDPRNKELEYTDFSDLKKIIENEDIISEKTKKQTLIDKLDYLNEARTLIAHNNIILDSEIQKLKDYCNVVRRILDN